MTFRIVPFALAFLGSLALSLLLTPVVREINRSLGIVDKPGPRRINKTPVPRGGGIAIFVAVFLVFSLLFAVFDLQLPGRATGHFMRICLLSAIITAVGYADDKFSLGPKVKLAAQIVVALLTWWWVGLGFSDFWPELPMWMDCILTVGWIVGAINAFNLIDGMDGLAAGLGIVATMGMAGGLFFTGHAGETAFYFAFAGGLLGFLRYNYHPATVFLGDSGSMMIGYILAVLPLCSHVPRSFLVSMGVPFLSLGVPIFDTLLAILRRTIRHAIVKVEGCEVAEGDSARVMTADHDHIHHRIMRAMGFNQRRAAWALYLLAIVFVAVGFFGLVLESRSGGLWLAFVAFVSFVIFRDMARVELFDAGRLLSDMARSTDANARRLRARFATPLYLGADLAAMILTYAFCCVALKYPWDSSVWRVPLLVRVAILFGFLVLFRTYVTVWSRAMNSNFARLFVACMFGTVAGSAILYYIPNHRPANLVLFTVLYSVIVFIAIAGVRMLRPVVRDLFYAIDCSRLRERKDVSRVIVYGAGLRYRTFRRELVRTTSANSRIIVGIIDDDVFLKNHFIGGIKVLGTLMDAPELVNKLNADAVVIAFDISDEWLEIVKKTLAPTGVRITKFAFEEKEI